MAQKKQIAEEIEINKSFKLLTRSYQEHAIGQINFARYSVLNSREFANDLEDVFSSVKKSYKKKILREDIKKLIKKNGKDVWVLITANNKLYGDLIFKITKLFTEKLSTQDPSKIDLIVIGRQGKDFLDQMKIDREYKYFELPDTNVSPEYLKELCKNFILYENVYVFYGKFNNVISQNAVESSLSGELNTEPDKTQSQQTGPHHSDNYLFEPTIEEILVFFENQILSLLLNQAVQENQLARFASRVNAMEIAQNNIQKQLNLLKHKEKLNKNMEVNKKQIELMAGRRLWTKK